MAGIESNRKMIIATLSLKVVNNKENYKTYTKIGRHTDQCSTDDRSGNIRLNKKRNDCWTIDLNKKIRKRTQSDGPYPLHLAPSDLLYPQV